MGFVTQLKHAWNVFTDQTQETAFEPSLLGAGASSRPDRPRFRLPNDRSIVTSIYTRISVDFSSIDIRHARLDSEGRYSEDMISGLQECLTVSANLDQTPSHFKRDLVLSMFESMDGTIAIMPVDTNINPALAGVDILSWRVGRVVQWYPRHVRLEVYNDRTGRHEQLTKAKAEVALIENPLSPIMNEPNSTLQRLIRKLSLLDAIDEQSGSGKLDMIIQLPYVVKTDTMQKRAEQRKKDIEFQLKDSQYGIAYTDGTEKITQLNRPAENNLLKQVEFLTEMLYGQLGITAEVMNGTADEKVMLNYINRTLEPLLTAVAEELIRKFLTKTARTQGQTILYFRDPFKLVPMSELAEMADKFTRNEIFSANEIRQFIGQKPSKDPKADELRNSNLTRDQTGFGEAAAPAPAADEAFEEDSDVEDPFTQVNQVLDEAFAALGVQE